MTNSEGIVVDNAGGESRDLSQNSNDLFTDSNQVQTAIDENLMEMEDIIFKVPPKRKHARVNKNAKKKDNLIDISTCDAEIESDFSDCSVSCNLKKILTKLNVLLNSSDNDKA